MGAHTMDEADHDADMMGDAPGESDMVPETGTDTGMMGHESQ